MSVAQEKTALGRLIEEKDLNPSPIASYKEILIDLNLIRGEIVIRSEIDDEFHSFDKEGNWNSRIEYFPNGAIGYKYEFIYDKLGNLTEEQRYTSDGILRGKEKYKYDEYGNRIEESVCDSEENLIVQNQFVYDEQSRKLEWIRYTDQGPDWHYTYKYDNKGNQIEKNSFKPDGTIEYTRTTEYVYDSNGNLIQESNYSDTQRIYRYDYGYDQEGNLIERAILNLASRSLHKYDKNGNTIESYFYSGDILSSEYRSKYDEKGNRTEWYPYKYQESEGVHSYHEPEKCTYEYDKYNNWTKRTCIPSFNTEPNYNHLEPEVVVREIEYHE